MDQSTRTSESLGTAPARRVAAESAPPTSVTAHVIDMPPVVMEDAQPVPVGEYVAPAPVMTYAAMAPVAGNIVPTPAATCEEQAPVVKCNAPAPAVTYAERAPVVEHIAPAPVVSYAAPAPMDDTIALAPATSCAALAPVIEYTGPVPAERYAARAPVVEHNAPSPAVTYAVQAPVVEHNAPSPVADVLEAAAPVIEPVAPAPADTYTAPAPVIAHVDPAPALSCAAPAPVNVYVPPVPAALVTAIGSLAPEAEVASTNAALAIERKRWCGRHLKAAISTSMKPAKYWRTSTPKPSCSKKSRRLGSRPKKGQTQQALMWKAVLHKDVTVGGESDRTVSFIHGSDVVTSFSQKHGTDLVCRAHQEMEQSAASRHVPGKVSLHSSCEYL